jgi:hypothetical protein
MDDSSAFVNGGVATIDALNRNVSIDRGEAVIRDVPAGTWVVSIRALGYRPQTVVLDAPTNDQETTIILSRGAHTLDAVVTNAKRAERDSAVVRDIDGRMRIASGTLIRGDNLAVVNASEASDAIRAARGFLWNGPTKVDGRVWAGHGTPVPCRSVSSADSVLQRDQREVAIYLNGDRVRGGLQMLNQMVAVKDILAIEAYPDVMSAPFEWRKSDTCAVVVFWTKH